MTDEIELLRLEGHEHSPTLVVRKAGEHGVLLRLTNWMGFTVQKALTPEEAGFLVGAVHATYTADPMVIPEALADMHARKDAAYDERDRVVAAFARAALSLGWKAGVRDHVGEDWGPEWRQVVIIETPTGQVSWHFPERNARLFEFLRGHEASEWDGHDTAEKYERLKRYTDDPISLIFDAARTGKGPVALRWPDDRITSALSAADALAKEMCNYTHAEECPRRDEDSHAESCPDWDACEDEHCWDKNAPPCECSTGAAMAGVEKIIKALKGEP